MHRLNQVLPLLMPLLVVVVVGGGDEIVLMKLILNTTTILTAKHSCLHCHHHPRKSEVDKKNGKPERHE